MTELETFLRAQYGAETSEQIQTGFSQEHPVSFRINRIKSNETEVVDFLTEQNIRYSRVGWYEDAFILHGVREAELCKTALYEEGKIYLQSLSSMLPPLYLEPQAGESVLDMTAAPGGKTTQLYALSQGKSLITACERDKIRYDRLKFNLARQGATRVSALCTDAATLDDFFSFDKILLDAPCSGSGTQTPSSPVRITKEFLQKCVQRQERLLKKALKLLKKGGVLVYSTCSILKEENDGLLQRVLPGSGGRLLPIAPPEGVPVLPSAEGTVCVCPSELYEGFFVAKITK